MRPATQPREITGWKGLVGCLGTGLLVLGVVGAVVWYFHRKDQDKSARIDREFLQPWFQAAREGRMDKVWETLGTENYRSRNPRAAVDATYRKAVENLGPLQSASVHVATGTTELLSERPAYESVGTKWIFGKDREIFLVFELVDQPGQGFRLDHARLGFTRKTGLSGGYHPPEGTPEGPW